jgi:hypothetical protein
MGTTPIDWKTVAVSLKNLYRHTRHRLIAYNFPYRYATVTSPAPSFRERARKPGLSLISLWRGINIFSGE